jgi:hypothetical protein
MLGTRQARELLARNNTRRSGPAPRPRRPWPRAASAAAAAAADGRVGSGAPQQPQQPQQQQPQQPPVAGSSIDWAAKRRKRLVDDLAQAR